MKSEMEILEAYMGPVYQNGIFLPTKLPAQIIPDLRVQNMDQKSGNNLPEVLFLSSYPPRICGIATYSQDLIMALKNKFGASFTVKVCALESGKRNYTYPDEVQYVLNTSNSKGFFDLARSINRNARIKVVVIQHEFGFYQKQGLAFQQLLNEIKKPVIVVFHTVIPKPDDSFKNAVKLIADSVGAIIVMTQHAAGLLTEVYGVTAEKISVIAHGTHLVPHLSKVLLKEKYGLGGRKVLSTFGLLSSGKSIETTLRALPAIIKDCSDVVFLIIGKTHPEVVKAEGEKYRKMLKDLVIELKLKDHVKFINSYLALPELLEYLQLTDIYLFTTNDPNQAVSGTFAYAMSCGCPIISTPIPHAKEFLTKDTGIIFDYLDSEQMARSVILLLNDEPLRKNLSVNTLQKIVSTSWENSAVEHAILFGKRSGGEIAIHYDLPGIKLDHIKNMTTKTGYIQFSKINQPDVESGYTLDDNARALIALCRHYELTAEEGDLDTMKTYLAFIEYCQQPDGNLLNYVDQEGKFTEQNYVVNLDDSNGRTVWALGYILSKRTLLPKEFSAKAKIIFTRALPYFETIHSPRAMAFALKGLYYYGIDKKSSKTILLAEKLANRLVGMYKHESSEKWLWYESYLTYANSVLPEAMLCAWLLTGHSEYRDIARESFDFLLNSIYSERGIEVISNRNWLIRGERKGEYGEQPIDVANTIISLSRFYDVFKEPEYLNKLIIAFNWFLGNNRLHQIVYNPCTGGCYDGMEETHVNLNQGAESTISYLLARLTIEKYSLLISPHNEKSPNDRKLAS